MSYLAPSEFVTKMVDAGESKIFMSTRDTVISMPELIKRRTGMSDFPYRKSFFTKQPTRLCPYFSMSCD
jgi:hypothetical protein